MAEEERKLKKVSHDEARKQELFNTTKRFLEEIDRICLDGRVKSMTDLEKELVLRPGKISEMERGRVWVDIYTLHRAKKVYNVDTDYVMHNVRRPELSNAYRKGVRIDIYEPFDRKSKNRRAEAKKERDKEKEKQEQSFDNH